MAHLSLSIVVLLISHLTHQDIYANCDLFSENYAERGAEECLVAHVCPDTASTPSAYSASRTHELVTEGVFCTPVELNHPREASRWSGES